MRHEKQFIKSEYVQRLNASAFCIIVDYKSLTVHQFTELRKRLRATGAEVHVVKNSIFRISAQEAGLGDLSSSLSGQVAVVTGSKDVSTAAKTVKTFQSEFEKPKIKLGYLGNRRLEGAEVIALAELPSIEVLRGKLLGLLQTPATQLVRVIGTPASQLARVIQSYSEKPAA